MAELTLQLFGGFRLHDAADGEIRLASRKGRALLAFLAMQPGKNHSRDRLATLLWEDADEELARTSLRQALTAVRKALPGCADDALIADAESVAIDPDVIDSDVAAFRRSLQAGTRTALKDGLLHCRGDLLEGFDARSSGFDEWLSGERLTLRKQVSEMLHKLTSLCVASEDADGALTAATRLVALEPLNESAHRTLMDLHARRGSYAEALRQYRLCRDALRRELDVAPEPATEQLYRDLMRRRRAATTEPGDSTTAEELPGDAVPAAAPRTQTGPTLRDATILVVRLQGLIDLEATLDPEESHALSVAFQQRVQLAVQDFGGRADRRLGSSVVAVFGLPSAYGNEAERAVRAALTLRDQMARASWPVQADVSLSMGIAQGQVLAGPEIFPLTGPPAHLAHGLATHAGDGEILVSDEIRRALGERIGAQRASGALAGSERAAAAWVLNCLRADPAGPEQPFVGRRPELAMIMAGLDRCTTSKHGRAVVIRGEAGIGKTRLVEAVRAAAPERGVSVHSAQVFDFGQSPSRRPITTLALSLLGLNQDAAGDERAAAVKNVVRSSGVDQTIFLSDLVDAPLDGELTALEHAMEVATRQRGRALALAQLIESAAQRSPLLIVIEDIHWSDSDELARFGELAAIVANCPILFVMTTRPEGDPISATWRARARGCPVTTVDLAPLADDEAQELAAHYPELPCEVVDACIVRAEGYPLFLDQLLRAASAGHDTLPGSVRTLVLARADRLSAQDYAALQAGAMLGHRFSLAALCSMIDQPEFEPAALLDAALMRADGGELQFAHALFRDAIYESTLKSRRRELHQRAAAWFAEKDLALHADHLAAAEDPGAGVAYIAAARSEQNALRFERALTLAMKACSLAREPRLLHESSCLLGELLLTLGRTHDALTAYREALDFAIDQTEHGQAWLGIASSLRIMDRHEEALEALDRAEAALADAADARMRARIYTLRGNLCFPLGRIEACLAAHQRAYEHAREASSPLDIARALGGLGDAYYQRGHMLAAHDHFSRSIAEARAHGLAGVLLANLPMLGITEMYRGNTDVARERYREALELARRISDVRGEMLVHLVTTSCLLLQGHTGESRARAQQTLQLARQLGAKRFQAECLGTLATVALSDGDRETAYGLVEEALQIARETSLSYCGPSLLGILARTTQNPVQRSKALVEGEKLLAAGCVSHSYFEFYGHAMEVCLNEGQWQEVRRYAAALEDYTRAEPVPLMTLMIARARLLAELGENPASANAQARLTTLRAECIRVPAAPLLPALDEALARTRDE